MKIIALLSNMQLVESRLDNITEEIEAGRASRSKLLKDSQLSAEELTELRKLKDLREDLLDQHANLKSKASQFSQWKNETGMLLKQVQNEKKFELRGRVFSSLESPRMALDISIGAALSLVLGCAVAFLLESVDNRLHTPFDVYYHLRLNYLGVVPFWDERESMTIGPDKPDSHIAEIYAHLRNNIRYGRAGNPEKCLLIASATQGEGKSTVAANLATSYALEGNNVVLIDADLRRPRSHKLIELFEGERAMQHGLSDYLTGEVGVKDITYNTAMPGLSLIPAGSRVRNPAKLMGSQEMKNLMEEAEQTFDIVVVDCPAVLPVVDATTLSSHVRGVLMVIAAEEVEVGAVRMALYRLQHVGSPVVGAVLNKVRERSTSYYYYGYRYRSGYYYSPYSEPYTENEDTNGTA